MPLDFAPHRYVQIDKEIEMCVYQHSDKTEPSDEKPAIVFLHGFPEMAYSWRHQLNALGELGYRTIAPDLRGYADTTAPDDVSAYEMTKLVGDMVALLDKLCIDEAVFVGHDMGSNLAYAMRAMQPGLCKAIVSLNIPMRKKLSINPIEALAAKRGGENYVVCFQRQLSDVLPNAAVAETILEQDVSHVFRTILKTTKKTLPELMKVFGDKLVVLPIGIFVDDPPLGDVDFLDEDEIQVYADMYGSTGFTGGINWYRNLGEDWRTFRDMEADAIAALPEKPAQYTPTPTAAQSQDVPILFLAGQYDPLVPPERADWMINQANLPLQVHTVACGHWMQQEAPVEVTRLIDDWIQQGYPHQRPST